MASISLFLILLAMGLIVAHRLAAEVNVSIEDRAIHDARKVLVVELVRAQRHLNERRTDDPTFLENAIKRSVRDLEKAQNATRKGVEQLSAASRQAVDELGAATAKTAADFGAVTAKSAADLAAISAKSVDNLNAVSADLVRQFEPLLQATAQAGASLSEASLAAVAAQRSNAEMTEQAGSAVRSLTGSVEQVATAKDEWSAALRDGLTANEQAIGGVGERIGDLVRQLRAHESTLQAQANELSRAADLSSQVLAELRERAESIGTGS
jgi:hypothetical protein